MIRRFNYTGRRRIRREDARISLRQNGTDVPTFDAKLNLDGYRLPGSARIFVEAYRPATSSYMRFDWGTIKTPTPSSRALAEFGRADGVLFRVKVVEGTDGSEPRPARLLALAERLQPRKVDSAPTQAFSLLHVVPTDDLDEVWKVDFPGDDDEPSLLMNRKLVDPPNSLVRHQAFIALVLPQVLRVVLTRILIIERFDDREDSTDWRAMWLRLCQTMPGVPDIPSPRLGETDELENQQDLEDWIDAASASFARRAQVRENFSDWWAEEERV